MKKLTSMIQNNYKAIKLKILNCKIMTFGNEKYIYMETEYNREEMRVMSKKSDRQSEYHSSFNEEKFSLIPSLRGIAPKSSELLKTLSEIPRNEEKFRTRFIERKYTRPMRRSLPLNVRKENGISERLS